MFSKCQTLQLHMKKHIDGEKARRSPQERGSSFSLRLVLTESNHKNPPFSSNNVKIQTAFPIHQLIMIPFRTVKWRYCDWAVNLEQRAVKQDDFVDPWGETGSLLQLWACERAARTRKTLPRRLLFNTLLEPDTKRANLEYILHLFCLHSSVHHSGKKTSPPLRLHSLFKFWLNRKFPVR